MGIQPVSNSKNSEIRSKYICGHCDAIFESEMNLRTHYDTKHPDNPEINKKQMNEFANIEKGVSNDLRTKPSEHIEENYSLMILKNRLAKGEITIEEFNNLKKVLDTE